MRSNDFYNTVVESGGECTYAALEITDPYFTFGKRRAKISNEAKSVLERHTIEVNLGAMHADISNYVRLKMD
jgi:hypothetical protein